MALAGPSIAVVGAYAVEADEQAYREAIACHGDAELARAELSSLALVELLVRNHRRRFDLVSIVHGPLRQAPYDATYLAVDSDEVLATGFDVPRRHDFRVCFFLHFYDPAHPLQMPSGDLALPPVSAMPARFAHLHYTYFD